jgi:hypothetical protein
MTDPTLTDLSATIAAAIVEIHEAMGAAGSLDHTGGYDLSDTLAHLEAARLAMGAAEALVAVAGTLEAGANR